MTPETVRLRVVAPDMPVPSETVVPLLSIHEMVGVGLPLTLVAHTRVMLPPSRTAVSASGPTNSGGSVMKKEITWPKFQKELELYTPVQYAPSLSSQPISWRVRDGLA